MKITVSFSTFVFFFSLIVAIPVEIYFSIGRDAREFNFTGVDLAIYTLPIALGLSLAGLLIFQFVSRRVSEVVVFSELLLAFLVYIQSNFLVWKYPVFRGIQINWSSMDFYGYVEIGIFGVIVLAFIIFRQTVVREAGKLAAVMLFVHLATLAGVFLTAPESSWNQLKYLDRKDIGSLSNRENVVIFLFDTLQANFLSQLLDDEPDLLQALDGFTFFENHTGGYPGTFPSVPLLMTGEYYHNQGPLSAFLNKGYHEGYSIPRVLSEDGFRLSAVAQVTPTVIGGLQNYLSNLRSPINPFYKLTSGQVDKIVGLYLFRTLPHFLKRVFISGRIFYWLVGFERDTDLVSAFTKSAAAVDQEKTFKYVHLVGAHPPLMLDENSLLATPSPNEVVNYQRQFKGVFRNVRRLLESMKNAGVYDNSVIVIMGDHGAGIPPRGSELSEIEQSALPVLLIKPKNAHGDLQTSQAPTTMADISSTIFALLGIDNPGVNAFALSKDAERTRKYYAFHVGASQPDDYLPPMTVSRIEGPVRDAFSWSREWGVWKAGRFVPAPVHDFGSGQTIGFGVGGNAANYTQSAEWTAFGGTGAWINGKFADLRFTLDEPADLLLSGEIWTYRPSGADDFQKLWIEVNGRDVGGITFFNQGGPGKGRVIPRIFWKEGVNTIRLIVDRPFAQAWEDGGVDLSPIGVHPNTLALDTSETLNLHSPALNFGTGGNAIYYESGGFSWPTDTGVWLLAPSASILLPFEQNGEDIVLELDMNAYVADPAAKGYQNVDVVINDNCRERLQVSGRSVYSLSVQAKCNRDDYLELKLEFPDAAAPADFGLNDDTRRLGVMLNSISFAPADTEVKSDTSSQN